jgi:hypothetical protein
MHHITTLGVLEPACVRCASPLAAARCIPPDVPNRALCFHHVPCPAARERHGRRRNQQTTANASVVQWAIPFPVRFLCSPAAQSTVQGLSSKTATSAILPSSPNLPKIPRQVTRIAEHARHHAHTVSVPFQIPWMRPPSLEGSCHASWNALRRRLWLRESWHNVQPDRLSASAPANAVSA